MCFFSPRLEVCVVRLKDRFLTHGGLALWSRKHKWCGCLSVPLCCCPPPPPPSVPPLSLRSILLHTAHCALVTHSSSPPSPSFSERLEPEASVTVSMGVDFSDSTQAANFQLWWDNLTSSHIKLCFSLSDLQLYISFTFLFFSLKCLLLLLLLAFASLIRSLLIFLFRPALCQHSQVRHQPRLIPVHWDNNYSSSNQPQPKSTCRMPSAPPLSRSITLSENLFRMGGINRAQNAIHRAWAARQSEEKRLIHKQNTLHKSLYVQSHQDEFKSQSGKDSATGCDSKDSCLKEQFT